MSPYNYVPEANAIKHVPSRVLFHDCTLRDGEQHPGLVFRKQEKLQIAGLLDELRIPQIEAGTPAVSQEDRDAIKLITHAGFDAKITALCRLLKEDIDMALACDVWGVICSAPAGYLQLQHKLKWSEEKFVRTVLEACEYAKSHGLYTILSPYDTTRSEIGFLERLLKEVSKEHIVDRVRLVDTAGCATPSAIRYLAGKMIAAGNMPVEVHCHDDLGLATSNTLAGVEAGAEVVSTTINGIGERSGNTPTEEVATALKVLYGVDPGLKLDFLPKVSKVVEKLSRVRLQQHKAVVGKNAFTHESGLIVGGVLELPFTGEPYSPDLIGRKRHIVLGKKSGSRSIEHKLAAANIVLPDAKVDQLLEMVKERSIAQKGLVSDKEFYRMVKALKAKTKASG